MHGLPKVISSKLSRFRMPIVSGPLRGYWWSPFGRGKVLRYLLGSYELNQAEYFAKHIDEGSVVFDVGANLGYFTLLFAHAAGLNGRVVAFEPSPDIVRFLKLHIDWNHCRAVSVYEAAVGAEAGQLRFDTQRGSGTGCVSQSGDQCVDVVALDEIAQKEGVVPDLIKIDVEGFAPPVLAGAVKILATAQPTIYISMHSDAERNGCLELLRRFGYRCTVDDLGELICRVPGKCLPRHAAA